MAANKTKKDFTASPFRQLKGFCVSAGPEKKGEPEKSAPPPPKAEADLDFAAEMARLGVKGKGGSVPADPPQEDPPALPSAPAEDEGTLFLAAIGRLDATFADKVPAAPAQPATPRLKQLLRNESFTPAAELDLHGLDRLQAIERVRHFLDNAVYQGMKTALLITGRGHGSTGEPILRTEVENFLAREGASWVAEWTRAPRRFGGDGAVIVLLRGKKK